MVVFEKCQCMTKPVPGFRHLHWRCDHSQARRFPFYLHIKTIIMSKKKHTTKKAPRRSKVIVIRLTPDLYEELKQKAQKAGKSMSSLGRDVLLGIKLFSHLTPEEGEALASLSDCRADLVNIRNALKVTPEEVKMKIFKSQRFMSQWLLRIDRIANECESFLSKHGL